MAVGLLGKAINQAQAQPVTLAHLLGGEERFECARKQRFRHALAIVGHRDHHIGAVANVRMEVVFPVSEQGVGRRDGKASAGIHGVLRVQRQIE
jgi:hypothetical protein